MDQETCNDIINEVEKNYARIYGSVEPVDWKVRLHFYNIDIDINSTEDWENVKNSIMASWIESITQSPRITLTPEQADAIFNAKTLDELRESFLNVSPS